MYAGFGALRFLARNAEGIDVPPPGDGAARATDTPPDLIVILAERQDELPMVQEAHPGGVLESFYSAADRRLLFWVYSGFER